MLYSFRENGFDKAAVHTVNHIIPLKKAGFGLFGTNRLNCTNTESLEFFCENGIHDMIVSCELTVKRMNSLGSSVNKGFLAYGNLPLMLARRCPVRDGAPCRERRNCGAVLTDRKGNKNAIICSQSAVEILNSHTLWLSDKLGDFKADFAVLRFSLENDIGSIIKKYVGGTSPEEEDITRGLYYRGVE